MDWVNYNLAFQHFHHLKKPFCHRIFCFLVTFNSRIALLSGLFPFYKTLHFVALSSATTSPSALLPPGLLTLPPVLPPPSSLLGGKSGPSAPTLQCRGRKKLGQACDSAPGDGKAQSSPTIHSPLTSPHPSQH